MLQLDQSFLVCAKKKGENASLGWEGEIGPVPSCFKWRWRTRMLLVRNTSKRLRKQVWPQQGPAQEASACPGPAGPSPDAVYLGPQSTPDSCSSVGKVANPALSVCLLCENSGLWTCQWCRDKDSSCGDSACSEDFLFTALPGAGKINFHLFEFWVDFLNTTVEWYLKALIWQPNVVTCAVCTLV